MTRAVFWALLAWVVGLPLGAFAWTAARMWVIDPFRAGRQAAREERAAIRRELAGLAEREAARQAAARVEADVRERQWADAIVADRERRDNRELMAAADLLPPGLSFADALRLRRVRAHWRRLPMEAR